MTTSVILYHALPIVGYVLSSLFFYRLARVPATYPRWSRGWACLTAATVGLSLTRVFNILDALTVAPMDFLIAYQTALVILSSALLAVGSWHIWQVFREGSTSDG